MLIPQLLLLGIIEHRLLVRSVHLLILCTILIGLPVLLEVVLEPLVVIVVERLVIRGPWLLFQQVAPSGAHGPLLGNGTPAHAEQPAGHLRHGLRSRRILIPQPPLVGVTKHRLLMRGVLLRPSEFLLLL